jgi:hypothetical protein
MLGGFGQALIFLATLAATAVVGTYVLLYAAHSLLVTINGTAVGEDVVRWPDEPILDWMGGALHLIVLALLWLVPIGIIARAVAPTLAPSDKALGFLMLAVPALWFFYPIGVLSSLSSASRWVFFRPAIAIALLRLFPYTVLFYLVSAILWVGGAALWYVAILTTASWVLVLAALVSATGILIYGRLLGRLAWLIHRLNPEKPSLPSAELPVVTAPKKNKAARKRPRKPASNAVDPWAIPEEEEKPKEKGKVRDPWGREMDEPESYGLARAQTPPIEEAPPPRKRIVEDDDSPLSMTPPESEPPREKPQLPPELDAATKRAIEERERGSPAPPPPSPLVSGVYTFPWYEQSMKAWVWLAFGSLLLGFMIRMLMQLVPT